ncbi:helix-turn-helix transcriptional regulator [Mycolicibacterium madagascariense]|nr:helix-turn-helix transcriptional regulator [Mycolicibacterium madagascariense]
MDGADARARDRGVSAPSDVDTAAWSQRFDLLSDPTRLEILLVLHRVPGINVGDLATAVGRSENAVSQALRVLRRLDWVHSTRVGRSVSYRLQDAVAHDLLHWIGAKRSAGRRP